MEGWVHGPMNQWVDRSMDRVERALDLESDRPRLFTRWTGSRALVLSLTWASCFLSSELWFPQLRNVDNNHFCPLRVL